MIHIKSQHRTACDQSYFIKLHSLFKQEEQKIIYTGFAGPRIYIFL